MVYGHWTVTFTKNTDIYKSYQNKSTKKTTTVLIKCPKLEETKSQIQFFNEAEESEYNVPLCREMN